VTSLSIRLEARSAAHRCYRGHPGGFARANRLSSPGGRSSYDLAGADGSPHVQTELSRFRLFRNHPTGGYGLCRSGVSGRALLVQLALTGDTFMDSHPGPEWLGGHMLKIAGRYEGKSDRRNDYEHRAQRLRGMVRALRKPRNEANAVRPVAMD
jgi:hypothetical protein